MSNNMNPWWNTVPSVDMALAAGMDSNPFPVECKTPGGLVLNGKLHLQGSTNAILSPKPWPDVHGYGNNCFSGWSWRFIDPQGIPVATTDTFCLARTDTNGRFVELHGRDAALYRSYLESAEFFRGCGCDDEPVRFAAASRVPGATVADVERIINLLDEADVPPCEPDWIPSRR